MAVQLTDENFTEQTAEGVTLIDFYADWCGPCKMIAPIIEELSTEVDGATIAKVDIDQQQAVTRRFDVTSVPTIIILKNGEEVNRVIGVKGKDELKELVESFL